MKKQRILKKITLFLILTINFTFGKAQNLNFQDQNLKNILLYSKCAYLKNQGNNNSLKYIDTNNNNEIDVSEANEVIGLDISDNGITYIDDIVQFSELETLDCRDNEIKYLDLFGHNKLRVLSISDNDMISLDLRDLNALEELYFGSNDITNLEIKDLPKLETIGSQYTGLSVESISIKNLPSLKTLSLSDGHYKNFELENVDSLISLSLVDYKIKKINIDKYKSLQSINLLSNDIDTLRVDSLENLEILDVSYNDMKLLDLGHLPKLSELYCDHNRMDSLKVENLQNLKTIDCSVTYSSKISLKGCISLENVLCNSNFIKNIDFTGLHKLQEVNLNWNSLSGLEINSPLLKELSIASNPISNFDSIKLSDPGILENLNCGGGLSGFDSINLVQFVKLRTLGLNYSNLMYLDVSSNKYLYSLSLREASQLKYILAKNGRRIDLGMNNNHELEYICCDKNDIYYYSGIVADNNLTCEVNSYCDFTSGIFSNTFKGKLLYDIDSNNCISEYAVDKTKVNLYNDSNELNALTFSSNLGIFQFRTAEGNFEIIPKDVLPYYDFIPKSASINFNSTDELIEQTFCLTPLGSFNDLEIIIVPVTVARPGFNAKYQIIVNNVGTEALNGEIILDYEGNLLKLIESSLDVTLESENQLQWSIANIDPMESITIELEFLCNSPMNEPSLNNLDTLYFVSYISTSTSDETPENNTSILSQIVVGSYDPNDKHCISGENIDISEIDNQLIYRIRFENTGSYLAQNVVINDALDLEDFDFASIEIISSSHDLTVSTYRNTLDFIFQDIELSHIEGFNTGFICFQITPNEQAYTGQILENTAKIYFDYNFPIVTNESLVEITTTSSATNLIQNKFSIYPNPANQIIYFNSEIQNGSYFIVDINGIITPIALTNHSFNIEGLSNGFYKVLCYSSDEVYVSEFIKQ